MKKSIIKNIFLLLCSSINISVAAQNIPVEGALFGRPFSTSVDHELAKIMLTNPEDSSVLQFYSNYDTQELNTETLSKIVKKYSFDVAALYFVKRIYGLEKNRHIQDDYLAAIDTLSLKNAAPALSFLQNYFIAFVPGFRYKHINNGGDFIRQRLLLESAGIAHELIAIEETGLVDVNAHIIADRLQKLNLLHRNIIVISVSKGGLETAIALGKLAIPESISSVKAWINVGGILKGTPVADRWAKPFMRFWISCGLFWKGIKVNLNGLLTDMSYKNGVERYSSLKIPQEIYTVNLTSVPLGQQDKSATFTSPNDRFSPLADAVTENGSVVIEMGLDHYFGEIDLNIRMTALLRYIVKQLN